MHKNATKYEPYKKGYFPATDGHKLYYELFGNPKGIPLVFLHGGPGAGFGESSKRFFNPKIFNVLLFDQRGAGRSKPFASLKENTTDKLVDDTKKILDFLKFKKVIIFGGSWGSTLALIFAIRYPEYVLGLILRGIFLASKRDIDFYVAGGVKNHFPAHWKRFLDLVPKTERGSIAAYYLKQMQSKDPAVAEKHAFEWAYYETSLVKLITSDEEIIKELKEFAYKSLAILEAHYMANYCFLEENYILKNAQSLSRFPVSIIHGRYDFVCPPVNAHKLHQKIKGSTLHFVTAGHSSSDKEIEKKLISELNQMGKRIKWPN